MTQYAFTYEVLGIFTMRFVVVHNKMHMMHESVCNVTYIN